MQTANSPMGMQLTPFEQSLTAFVNGIKTDWPPFTAGLSNFVVEIGKVDWGKLGDDFNTGGKYLGDIVNFFKGTSGKPVDKADADPAGGSGITGGRAKVINFFLGDIPGSNNWVNSMTFNDPHGKFGAENGIPSTGLPVDFSMAPPDMKPLTVPYAYTLNTDLKLQTQTSGQATTDAINKQMSTMKTTLDALSKSSTSINLFLPTLPSLISAAVKTSR
jgi:hypothetical protein